MTIRVILGEDSFIAREGITRTLEGVEDIELVAVCDDLDSLREAVLESGADVVLSQHAEPLYAIALFEEGSSRRAYLLKERVSDPSELIRVLREVAEGRSAVDPSIVERLLDLGRHRENSRLDLLTPRELETLALIAEGRSNGAIAESLVITKRAVERHVNGIFLKLDLGASDDISRRVKAALLYLAGQVG